MVVEMEGAELLGLTHRSLKGFGGVQVHGAIVAPLTRLSLRAQAFGFELAIASGYRSFERQLLIWNAKAQGQRPVLDDDGSVIDVSELSDVELLFAILRWSALPGASRHHWGTDVDVYDAVPSKEGYKLQLTVEETVEGAVYGPFYQWLDEALSLDDSGFFRPYTKAVGGVAPEPWHLSYAPLSLQYQSGLSKGTILDVLKSADIALKSAIIGNFDEIFDRFIVVDKS